MTSDHLFQMPTAAETGAAMATGKKPVARIFFKWANRKWYKLADVPVEGEHDTRALKNFMLTVEAGTYHHAVRYGQPVPKTQLPKFLIRKDDTTNEKT